MLVLGIESTCDETACAVVKDGKIILSNVIFSQASLHANYGGVFPEVASRAHIEKLVPAIDLALKEAGVEKEAIDLIAVAKAPGLVGGLLLGVEAAKALSLALNKPFIGVNHVEAHMYAAMMKEECNTFPSLGVVLSGGHTLLVKITEIGTYEVLATTIDDALGEAFDKLAIMLGLSYPGGALIEKLALEGDPKKYALSPGRIKERPLDFSYSGLKTACRVLIEKQATIDETFKKDLAASFQQVVFSDLIKKIKLAASTHGLKKVYLGGGVMCNMTFREKLQEEAKDLEFVFADKMLCLDNGAMIAGLGFARFNLQKVGDDLDLLPQTRTPRL
jgi:N6-L-threonylcarbamoyladenine synthase